MEHLPSRGWHFLFARVARHFRKFRRAKTQKKSTEKKVREARFSKSIFWVGFGTALAGAAIG
jgi:hypothetical protein